VLVFVAGNRLHGFIVWVCAMLAMCRLSRQSSANFSWWRSCPFSLENACVLCTVLLRSGREAASVCPCVER
jgi:hypothetical protein